MSMVNSNDYEIDKPSLAWICLQLRVRPGQSTLAFYTAENNSSMPITGVSTYNVTPMKVCCLQKFQKLSLIIHVCGFLILFLFFGDLKVQFSSENSSPEEMCRILILLYWLYPTSDLLLKLVLLSC